MLEIRHVDPQCADALALLHEASVDAWALYPELFGDTRPEANNGPPTPESLYLVAYEDGVPLACGALRAFGPTTAEIRRMYVHRDHRRRGLAHAVLQHLIAQAPGIGYRDLVLETGIKQGPAMRLYEGAGFQRIAPFGEHVDDPTSVCYGRSLAAAPHPHLYKTTLADPEAPECQALLEALSDTLLHVTGSSGQASFSASEAQHEGSCFALARNAEGTPVACGAIRPLEPGIAELKRMYAQPGTQGAGATVLAFLEDRARGLGYNQMWLETRKVNQRAVAFYVSHGYQPIANFGRYVGRPEAVCLAKLLGGGSTAAPTRGNV